MRTVLPEALHQGDRIGVVSLASPVAAVCPRRFDRGVAALEAKGFRVTVGAHARSRTGYTAGSISDRLDDLHGFFADPQVKAIVSAIGGFNSNQLLDELDLELVAANPKVFLGYSDTTFVQAAIFKRTGLAVVDGPAIMPQFGEFGGPHPYVWESFVRTLMLTDEVGEVGPAGEWITELLLWDEQDDRPRQSEPAPPWLAIKEGAADGRVVAANTSTLLALAGTDWWPDLQGAILCLEDDETVRPPIVERQLTQLRQLGVFGEVAGLIFGRFPLEAKVHADTLAEMVARTTHGYEFPVACDLDFGHTNPRFLLPWGVRARLEAGPKVSFALLEPAVSAGRRAEGRPA